MDGKIKWESCSFTREREGVPTICPLEAWVLAGVYVVMELWHVKVGGGKGRTSTMSKHFVTKLFICIIPISHGTKRKVQEGGQGEMPGDEIRYR